MEVDDSAVPAPVVAPVADKADKPASKKEKVPEGPLAALPEGDIYMSLLVVIWLLDQKKYSEVRPSVDRGWTSVADSFGSAGQGARLVFDRDHERAQPKNDGPARVQGLLLLGPPPRAQRRRHGRSPNVRPYGITRGLISADVRLPTADRSSPPSARPRCATTMTSRRRSFPSSSATTSSTTSTTRRTTSFQRRPSPSALPGTLSSRAGTTTSVRLPYRLAHFLYSN